MELALAIDVARAEVAAFAFKSWYSAQPTAL